MHRGGTLPGARIGNDILLWIAAGALAYTIGSIPTAYLVTRVILGRDIRSLGDLNSGAANVFRNVGPRAGLVVGGIDIIKGGLAVISVKLIFNHTGMEIMAGFLAVAGHSWPVFLRFVGGRGAATAVGVLIAMLPLITLPLGALSLVALYYTRKAIVALAMFLIGTPFLVWLSTVVVKHSYPLEVGLYALFVPIMVGLIHFISTKVITPRLAGAAATSPD